MHGKNGVREWNKKWTKRMYEYIILKRVKITTRRDAYEENKDHHDNIYVTYKRAYFP